MGKLTNAIVKNDIRMVADLLNGEYWEDQRINTETHENFTEFGYGPLEIACHLEHEKIIEMLLYVGGAERDPVDNSGLTPLYAAVYYGKVDLVNTLLGAGANPNFKAKGDVILLNVASMRGHKTIVTCLQKAIENYKTTELIIQTNVSISKADNTEKSANMRTMLSDIFYDAIVQNNIKLVKNLLSRKYSDPLFYEKLFGGVFHNKTSSNFGTSLYNALEKKHLRIIKLLLEVGAKSSELEIPFRDGWTPLCRSINEDDVKFFTFLIKLGINPDVPQKFGLTPLCIAAKKNNLEIIKLLIDAKAKLDKPAGDGRTPLCFAAQEGCVGAAKLLLKFGAAPNFTLNNSQSALYLATQSGHIDIVRVLLDSGADIKLKLKHGFSAMEIAHKLGFIEIFELIKKYERESSSSLNLAATSDVTVKSSFDRHPQTTSLLNPIVTNSPTPILKQNAQSLPYTTKTSPNSITEEFGVLKISFNIPYEQLILGEELGRGGFGVVHQGTFQKHTDVAIKQLHVTRFSEETLSEFKREMEVMAQLRSPNIIQLYGICTTPYCMVMEYMPKGALYHVLRSKESLPWSVREPIALDISKGLAYLHCQNILHRDLKSLNVLLDKHMKAKLCDFGLAKVKTESSSQSNNGVAGTLLWMAPELFKRKAVCTKESDVYSLGMTLWELASREIPFKDASNQALAKQWISEGEREDIPKDTPSQISKMITLCWDQEVANRPRIDQVVEALKETSNNTQSKPQYLSNNYSKK